jgi:5-methylcytosine-specific restriction endonuclease McrA
MGEVLVLNADVQPYRWNPLSVVSWKWGVKSYFLNKVDVLEWYDYECRSPSTSIRIPSVVILHEYHRARNRVNFTKRNVFIRDRHECQYCGKRFPLGELTCDHVMPRCRGGKTTWENIVTCCRNCNRKKGQRTDIKPLHEPCEMDYWDMVRAVKQMRITVPDLRWQNYLRWPDELVQVRLPHFQ